MSWSMRWRRGAPGLSVARGGPADGEAFPARGQSASAARAGIGKDRTEKSGMCLAEEPCGENGSHRQQRTSLATAKRFRSKAVKLLLENDSRLSSFTSCY